MNNNLNMQPPPGETAAQSESVPMQTSDAAESASGETAAEQTEQPKSFKCDE